MSKKLYIWERVDELTMGYHTEGGLVVITAGDPQEAYETAEKGERHEIDHDKPFAQLGKADRVIDVPEAEADAVYVFPDAGCC